jgi:hypothetical protein
MSTIELVELIEKLPLDKQKVVENFVHMLSGETGTKSDEQSSENNQKKLKREFGGLKYMADDFDAPLDDFKEYM